jgi:hypothetical protein
MGYFYYYILFTNLPLNTDLGTELDLFGMALAEANLLNGPTSDFGNPGALVEFDGEDIIYSKTFYLSSWLEYAECGVFAQELYVLWDNGEEHYHYPPPAVIDGFFNAISAGSYYSNYILPWY